MLWSPPRVTSLGFPAEIDWLDFRGLGTGRVPSSRKASYIWRSARPLSLGEIGISPQSRMLAQDL